MKTLAVLLLAATLYAQPPAPAPTVESLTAQLKAKDAEIGQKDAVIAKLKADLADAEARRDVGWTMLNSCVEGQVQMRKQAKVPQQ